eukprot:TRINITY_DN36491_c0_g2_i6.p1 TRINITY_DN36491_c0_g2~~TRINITY_DN36491_c0_g2_i6.p1  ORF type:complete len:584 (+),score=113.07 TRINITY_DN36491_c0_g2_i6:767-2518(+)
MYKCVTYLPSRYIGKSYCQFYEVKMRRKIIQKVFLTIMEDKSIQKDANFAEMIYFCRKVTKNLMSVLLQPQQRGALRFLGEGEEKSKEEKRSEFVRDELAQMVIVELLFWKSAKDAEDLREEYRWRYIADWDKRNGNNREGQEDMWGDDDVDFGGNENGNDDDSDNERGGNQGVHRNKRRLDEVIKKQILESFDRHSGKKEWKRLILNDIDSTQKLIQKDVVEFLKDQGLKGGRLSNDQENNLLLKYAENQQRDDVLEYLSEQIPGGYDANGIKTLLRRAGIKVHQIKHNSSQKRKYADAMSVSDEENDNGNNNSQDDQLEDSVSYQQTSNSLEEERENDENLGHADSVAGHARNVANAMGADKSNNAPSGQKSSLSILRSKGSRNRKDQQQQYLQDNFNTQNVVDTNQQQQNFQGDTNTQNKVDTNLQTEQKYINQNVCAQENVRTDDHHGNVSNEQNMHAVDNSNDDSVYNNQNMHALEKSHEDNINDNVCDDQDEEDVIDSMDEVGDQKEGGVGMLMEQNSKYQGQKRKKVVLIESDDEMENDSGVCNVGVTSKPTEYDFVNNQQQKRTTFTDDVDSDEI